MVLLIIILGINSGRHLVTFINEHEELDIREAIYSWDCLSETQISKHVGRSVLRYNGLELPVEMRSFFNAESLSLGEKIEITLVHKENGVKYNSWIQMESHLDEHQVPYTRIYWDATLDDQIHDLISDTNNELVLIFDKSTLEKNEYYIKIGENELQSRDEQLKCPSPTAGNLTLPEILTEGSQENTADYSVSKSKEEAKIYFKKASEGRQEPVKNECLIEIEHKKILSLNKLSREQRLYAEVLTNQFPSGININNLLQVVRYIKACQRAFSEKYNEEWVTDYDHIFKEIQGVTVACDETTRLSVTSLNISDSLLEEILVLMHTLFESGEVIVSSNELYLRFKSRLLQTNIYNSTTLENVVRYCLRDKYSFIDGYICSQEISDLDGYIFDRVLTALLKFSEPMSIEELMHALPHFPKEKIRDCLKRSPEVIRGKRGYYTHIDCFDITLQDKELLRTTVTANMRDNEITTSGLFDAYLLINPDFFDRNIITDIVALSDIFKYCYPSEYTYKPGQIIKCGGSTLSSTEKVIRHLMSMESFTYQDMERYINSNHYNVTCRGVLKPILLKYFRLDKNRFVSIGQLIIPEETLEQIENLLMDELQAGYVCSANIKNYLSYPYVESNPCTPYLLESIIRIYGPSFRCPLKLIEYYNGCKKPRGIIVIANSDFNIYEDILIDVLSKRNRQKPFENQMEAIEYLKETKYMETAPRDGLTRMYSEAIARI